MQIRPPPDMVRLVRYHSVAMHSACVYTCRATTKALLQVVPVVVGQLCRRRQIGDNHHMLACLPELRPCFTSFPVAGRWGGETAHTTHDALSFLPLSISIVYITLFCSLSALSFSFAISFSPTMSLLSVFEVFPDPTATYGQREREREWWLTERGREKGRGREHIAWSVRSYKGLSAAGWLVVRIEKYMTDFLVNYPKWESRKCCLSLSHADKHISHWIFFLRAHTHTHTHTVTHTVTSTQTQAPWVLILFLPTSLSLSLSLSLPLSLSLFSLPCSLFTNTHSCTQKTFKVTLLKHLL